MEVIRKNHGQGSWDCLRERVKAGLALAAKNIIAATVIFVTLQNVDSSTDRNFLIWPWTIVGQNKSVWWKCDSHTWLSDTVWGHMRTSSPGFWSQSQRHCAFKSCSFQRSNICKKQSTYHWLNYCGEHRLILSVKLKCW